jgi:hypothetical protein
VLCVLLLLVACCAALQELGALMLKAGKSSEASKHLAQGLEMLVRG